MKKVLYVFVTILVLASCSDDDFGGNGTLQSVNFSVTLKYDNETYDGSFVNGGNITLTNTATGDVYTVTSNENGVAGFESILPGIYNISVTKSMNNTEFNSTFGYNPTTLEVQFNGSQEQTTVNTNVTSTTIILKSARVGDLVIKQIYYAGSHIQQGAVFRDQFMEIYNNSNEVIYADGLYIGQLYGKNNTTTDTYTLSSGQYDWSQSIGMTAGSTANTDYVYADYVLQIPGTGEEYPINPDESIVIAQSALNHKAPLTDNAEKPLEVQDPSLTVDLSGADFEVYLGNWRASIGEEVYRYDIDNPAVQDLNIAYWGNPKNYSGNRDFIMGNLGRDSFIIFRSDDFATYTDYPNPSVTTEASNTKYFVQIPNTTIIDGVDLQHYNPSSQRPKMLPSEIDTSSINCDAAYNSQSIIRKTKTTINGRIILEDSNDSANDFVKLAMANPGGFAP
ncbi:MAG: DUF4876 domain-containing protein [Flavobacteriales bacterium]